MTAEPPFSNKQFAEQFRKGTETYFVDHVEYKIAVGLILYWQDHDLDKANRNAPQHTVETEVQSFSEVLQGDLNFQTHQFAIPSNHSLLKLREFLDKILLDCTAEESSLLVIYYAGHNDKGDDGEAVLTAKEVDGPMIPWRKIQQVLDDTDADVLLLLDCCHAALVAKYGTMKMKGKFEVLAASAEGVQTPRPGPRSFTNLLVWEMKTQIRERSKVDCSLLHRELMKSKSLTETPFRVSQSSQARIVLHPLPRAGGPRLGRRSITQLLVRVSMAEDPSARQMVDWFKAHAPENITAVNLEAIISRARMWQDCFDYDIPPGSLLSKLSEPALQEIIRQLRVLNSAMKHTQELTSGEGLDISAPAAFQKIQSATTDVADALETSCLLDLSEADLASALQDGEVGNPDVVEAIRLRQQVSNLQAAPANLEISIASLRSDDVSIRPSGPARFKLCKLDERAVLVEYFSFEPDPETGDAYIRTEQQVIRMAAILHTPKRASFSILQGSGYVRDSAMHVYGMVYELPLGFHRPRQTRTLQQLYQDLKLVELSKRIALARKLATAVDELHRVGWLHKSISSSNIVFLAETPLHESIVTQPWVLGFEYCRPEDAETFMDEDHIPETNVYRHPDRWGSPQTRFSRAHDVHSLGVVLTEIAFWQRILDIQPIPSSSPLKARPYADSVKGKCDRKLPHMVGRHMTDAILACFDYAEKTAHMSDFESQRYFQSAIRDRLR